MRSTVRIALTLLAAASLAGCASDQGAPTGPTQRLVAVGRLERGSTVRIVARDGLIAADSLVSKVTVSPATAGTVSGLSVKLIQAGSATVSATATDGRILSAVIDVALPPTVFFDAIVANNRDIYSVALDGGEFKRWTTSTGEESHPSVAAGTLVFASTRDGNGELYSLPTSAGGAERRLTTSSANETQPTLAAGGASLAYLSDAVGLPRVFVASSAFANPARLTAASFGFGGSVESDPTWSPTGDRIALMSTANGRANLFISSSAPGATPTAVAGSGSGQTDVEPAWSPDGNRIAFASTRAGGTQLFLFDLRTSAFTQITSGTGSSGQPAWLPDGRLIFTIFSANDATLWWVDPADPAPPVEIPTGTRSPAHGSAERK